MTYLQILNTIKDTALAQPNVNSVVREFLDLNREDAKYSAIVIQDRDGSRDRTEEQNYITYTWHLGYVDRLTYDESNRDDIISTGINIIDNIMNTIRNTWFPELEVSIVDRINTFNQRFTAQCAGVYVVLAVNVQVSDCVDSESTDLYDTYDAKITANGVYHFIPSGRPVDEINITVDTPGPKEEELLKETIISNGSYSYDPKEGSVFNRADITVDVHPSTSLSETYTSNGSYNITGEFNGGVITVDVPAPQFVTETLNVSTNGTYTPGEGVDGYSMVTVDVAGTDIQKDITEGIDYSYTTLNNNARFVASYRFYDRFINYEGSAIYLYSFTSINLPACSILYDCAFYHNNLSNISLPVCSYIGNWAFNGCNNLSNISLPVCSYIGEGTFQYCNNLSNISLPVCERIESYAFQYCNNLSNISLPVCSYIGETVFQYCNNLSNISLPVCSYIGNGAFNRCELLSNISLPVCSYIGETAFMGCNNLSNISLPVCSYIGFAAFQYCNNLSNISLPVCSYIGGGAFNGCELLSNISLPVCERIEYEAFMRCNNLSNISLPVCSYIGNGAFNECYSLSKLTLLYSSVVTIEESLGRNFGITPNRGSIFVPASLVDAYKSAPKWSYYSNRIFPISE